MKEWLLTEDLEALGFTFHAANNITQKAKAYGIAEKHFMGTSKTKSHICSRRAINAKDLLAYYIRQIDRCKERPTLIQHMEAWNKYKKILEEYLK